MAKFELDEEALRKIAAILEETGLTEIEVESEGHRIRVAKQKAQAVTYSEPAPAAGPAAAPQGGSAPASSGGVPQNAVTSPMVGTIYTCPEPGKPPFVSAGDQIKEGQTLLIIEAMKVMNTLPAPRSGIVKEVFVSDGQPVEFGEPLMVIE
ncbi:MAG: acetyl-CoA carboxylase biotin carboxyl carrier protein [Rhodovibrionaceae bacterium]